jgi:Na+/proline symporter
MLLVLVLLMLVDSVCSTERVRSVVILAVVVVVVVVGVGVGVGYCRAVARGGGVRSLFDTLELLKNNRFDGLNGIACIISK